MPAWPLVGFVPVPIQPPLSVFLRQPLQLPVQLGPLLPGVPMAFIASVLIPGLEAKRLDHPALALGKPAVSIRIMVVRPAGVVPIQPARASAGLCPGRYGVGRQDCDNNC